MTGRLHYPTRQPSLPPGAKLEPDDSYFLLRLHESCALLQSWRWGQAGTLMLKTSVQDSIHNFPRLDLHQINYIRYNQMTRLAAQINLTDWLPLYSSDVLHLELQYLLVKDKRLKELLDKIAKIDLSTKLMAIRWEVGVGLLVAELFGHVLNHLLQEGQIEQIFAIQVDLNVEKLQPGFMIATEDNYLGAIPTEFIITEHENLVLKNQYGYPFEETSYAVFELLPRRRLGERHWRETVWGQILLEGQQEALKAKTKREAERQKALNEFVELCYYARKIAAKDLRFISRHIEEIAINLEKQIEAQFFGQQSFTPESAELLPETWQRAFNRQTSAQLEVAVEYYYEALADTTTWISHYGISEE